jgi:magnesium transporter
MDDDIEESARFYEEDNGELHIRSDFLIDDDEDPARCAWPSSSTSTTPRCAAMACCSPSTTRMCLCSPAAHARAPCARLIDDAKDVLLKLFDADAEYSADTLERIYDDLEKASKMVLSGDVTDEMAKEVLGAIARQEDLNGRIRRNVMDTRRAVSF